MGVFVGPSTDGYMLPLRRCGPTVRYRDTGHCLINVAPRHLQYVHTPTMGVALVCPRQLPLSVLTEEKNGLFGRRQTRTRDQQGRGCAPCALIAHWADWCCFARPLNNAHSSLYRLFSHVETGPPAYHQPPIHSPPFDDIDSDSASPWQLHHMPRNRFHRPPAHAFTGCVPGNPGNLVMACSLSRPPLSASRYASHHKPSRAPTSLPTSCCPIVPVDSAL